MRKIIIFFILLSFSVIASADEPSVFARGWFRYAPYGRSLYADMHPYFPRMDIPYATNHPSYDWGDHNASYRWQTQGMFGINMPIWSSFFADSTFALSTNLQMSANLWMDLFDFYTSPIVDTDYRIGVPATTFLHQLHRGFVRNYSITWCPFKHESTHIGDELEIKQVERGSTLKRVNVSYNYTELILTLNEPVDRYAENHCFRVGLMLLWHGGWYNIDPEDGDGSIVDPRGTKAVPYTQRNPWELYLQYQYQSPTSRHGFQGIASAEVRNRELYGFDLTARTTDSPVKRQAEGRVFTYNIFVGACYNTPGYTGYFSRIALGLRAYHGNCPFGQFRSVSNYSQIGVCMIFD